MKSLSRCWQCVIMRTLFLMTGCRAKSVFFSRPVCAWVLLLLAIVALGFESPTAFGSTATTNFSVTATVPSSCAIAATNLAFGTYAGTLNNATSTLSVTCTNTTSYNVGLDAGTASGATVTTRQMSGSASLLSYALYSDAGRTLNWGQTVGTDTVAGTGSGAVQSLSVYGQVPASQFPNPGSYTDTITVTVTY